VPRVVLVIDNSGSIDDGLLRRFTTELQALTRRLEAALVLVVGDDQVREVRHFEPGRGDLDDLAVSGGGGTDFTPLLEEASQHAPDLIVVLTDLDGPVRFRPRCAVLWAVTEADAGAQVPFGRLLVLR
jgi:predicted metal-dependent peptidase